MKALMVIASKNFRDEEYFRPKEALAAAGVSVTTASSVTGRCTGKLGGTAAAEVNVGEARAADFDTVLFIGGGGAEEYFDNEKAHSLARDCESQGKVLGAICIAPVILANAGLLKGRRATVYKDGGTALERGGAEYTAANVEVDGRIVTASGPHAAAGFAEAVLRLLKPAA